MKYSLFVRFVFALVRFCIMKSYISFLVSRAFPVTIFYDFIVIADEANNTYL